MMEANLFYSKSLIVNVSHIGKSPSQQHRGWCWTQHLVTQNIHRHWGFLNLELNKIAKSAANILREGPSNQPNMCNGVWLAAFLKRADLVLKISKAI